MRAWYFTEMPYPHLPPFDEPSTTRVSLPSSHIGPKIAAGLYNRYLDEHLIAEDAGLDLVVNEHHQTATCIDVAAPLSLAILARQTRNARLCILGNPIANRGDPIRIAEEMAMIDCISHGRVEAGFVRGVPCEIFSANTNPTETLERARRTLRDSVGLIVGDETGRADWETCCGNSLPQHDQNVIILAHEYDDRTSRQQCDRGVGP